ncbi:MAG: protein kinase domain-containing protein, partial [Panacagrimonas sp.]
MDNDRWNHVDQLLQSALDIPAVERDAYLRNACGGDQRLEDEVRSLLSAHDRAGRFLGAPAIDLAARELAGERSDDGSQAGPSTSLRAGGDPLIGQTLSHYRIVERIGAGGMGVLYKAEDTRLGRPVALKFVSDELSRDPEALDRFAREARMASALNHPNICTIHDIGEQDERSFIVMEYLEGMTLTDRLAAGSMSLNTVLDVGIQIADALDAAHTAGIIHRDIKPANIFIGSRDRVKVLDFGLAKSGPATPQADVTTIAGTRQGVVMGTAAYMAPEQARGEAVDHRADIWSFGLVLYEMVKGTRPPQAVRLRVEASPELERIVSKCLETERERRYQHAADLRTDLERLRRGQGATVTEDLLTDVRRLQEKPALESHQERALPPPPRPLRPSSRIGAAVLAALLIAGAIGAVWYWRPRPASSSTTTARSLAVLPLKSLDAGDNYLGLGIADAVIRRTSQTGGMIVRPTSAIQRYMAEDLDALTAARQLSTDVVLEGSVQRAGDRLRVSVNLLRVSDGASLWADNFDLRTTDIFEIQDRVAREVASHLQLRIDAAQQARLGRRPTTNPQAYEYYLR